MNLFFQIMSLQLLIFSMDDQECVINLGMFVYVFFWNIIKVNHFLHCFIILLHLISSPLHATPLLIPHTYASIESIDCILLSSFELKAILLTSSVKTVCLLLLNLCCVFTINLLFLVNSLWSFLILSTSMPFFFLHDSFYFQVELLLNSFYDFQI